MATVAPVALLAVSLALSFLSGCATRSTAGREIVHCEKSLEPSTTTVTSTVAPRANAAASPSAPPVGVAPFDRALAARLVDASVERARSCGEIASATGGPSGAGRVRITFAPDGSVAAIDLAPPYNDTAVGGCIARELTRVSLPPFRGEAVTVATSFDIPPSSPSRPDAPGGTNL